MKTIKVSTVMIDGAKLVTKCTRHDEFTPSKYVVIQTTIGADGSELNSRNVVLEDYATVRLRYFYFNNSELQELMNERINKLNM